MIINKVIQTGWKGLVKFTSMMVTGKLTEEDYCLVESPGIVTVHKWMYWRRYNSNQLDAVGATSKEVITSAVVSESRMHLKKIFTVYGLLTMFDSWGIPVHPKS